MIVRDKDLYADSTDNSAFENIDGLTEGGDTIPEVPTQTQGVETPEISAPEQTTKPAGEQQVQPTGEQPVQPTAEVQTESKGEEIDLMKILEEADALAAAAQTSGEEVKSTAKEIVSAVEEGKDVSGLADKLMGQLTEKEGENRKLIKTIDILQAQLDNAVTENLSMKYGNVDNDKLVSIINDDPNVKGLIAAEIKIKNGDEAAKEQAIGFLKSKLEALTGYNFDDIVSKKKQKETDAMMSENDNSMVYDTGVIEDDLYV